MSPKNTAHRGEQAQNGGEQLEMTFDDGRIRPGKDNRNDQKHERGGGWGR